MRTLLLSAVLGLGVLLSASAPQAQAWLRRAAYYSGYYYPSYYGGYYSSYYPMYSSFYYPAYTSTYYYSPPVYSSYYYPGYVSYY